MCSQCGREIASVRLVRGHDGPPVPGDHFVCDHCGARLVFDVTRRLRSLTPREFLALDIDVRRAIDAARKAVQRKGEAMEATVNPKLLLVACATVGWLMRAASW